MRLRVIAFLLVAGIAAGIGVVRAQEGSAVLPEDLTAGITAKEAELASLVEKIRALKEAQETKEGEQQRLTTTVERLEDRVTQARLELDHTQISIEEVRLRIRQTEEEILRLRSKHARLLGQLISLLRLLAILDRQSPLEALTGKGSFADFLGNRQAVARIQARVTVLLGETRALKQEREAREADLQRRRTDLEQLAKLQSAQRVALQAEEAQKRQALSRTVSEVARVESLLAEAQEARSEIQQDIFVLKNSGLRLSLKQAEDFARYAGGLTGVRPALLLAILKVESNVGTNVGSGRYPNDVHPNHREAFLRVTSKLGLDPATTPVSAKPTTYQGWGGALGPGQILPGTWEQIEPDVSRLTGNPRPSPFELLDAFTATAALLRNAGAAAGNEFEAINRYFAGPNWQRFTWYGDRVLAVAKEYESSGL